MQEDMQNQRTLTSDDLTRTTARSPLLFLHQTAAITVFYSNAIAIGSVVLTPPHRKIFHHRNITNLHNFQHRLNMSVYGKRIIIANIMRLYPKNYSKFPIIYPCYEITVSYSIISMSYIITVVSLSLITH